jgi:hypothetical protein
MFGHLQEFRKRRLKSGAITDSFRLMTPVERDEARASNRFGAILYTFIVGRTDCNLWIDASS